MICKEIAWLAGTVISAGNINVHVSRLLPVKVGLDKVRIVVAPHFTIAVIFGLAGIVPDIIVTYVLTVMVPAAITRVSHKTGFIEKVIEGVPVELRVIVLTVVLSKVLTGSTRSSDSAGSER